MSVLFVECIRPGLKLAGQFSVPMKAGESVSVSVCVGVRVVRSLVAQYLRPHNTLTTTHIHPAKFKNQEASPS